MEYLPFSLAAGLQNRKELTLVNVCFLWYNTF